MYHSLIEGWLNKSNTRSSNKNRLASKKNLTVFPTLFIKVRGGVRASEKNTDFARSFSQAHQNVSQSLRCLFKGFLAGDY